LLSPVAIHAFNEGMETPSLSFVASGGFVLRVQLQPREAHQCDTHLHAVDGVHTVALRINDSNVSSEEAVRNVLCRYLRTNLEVISSSVIIIARCAAALVHASKKCEE
jgi:hypothetical protein